MSTRVETTVPTWKRCEMSIVADDGADEAKVLQQDVSATESRLAAEHAHTLTVRTETRMVMSHFFLQRGSAGMRRKSCDRVDAPRAPVLWVQWIAVALPANLVGLF